MVKLDKSHYWKANVKVKAKNIAFTATQKIHRKGMRIDKIEIVKEQSWLNENNIIFDVGKRIKGWTKEQARTMKPSLADKLRYSFSGNSIPTYGYIPISTVDRLSGLSEPIADIEFTKSDILPVYPFKNVFVGENGNYVNQYYYTVPDELELQCEVFCWTKDFAPTDCKAMLDTFGTGMGLGDLHSQGFGKFTLSSFEITEEGDIL